jgi:glycosyltransferase involved in cell wall biosynthesis
MNSIGGIERCLQSLREAGAGEVIVVDANSTDGTREIAEKFADQVMTDPGTGLGRARNVGIAVSSKVLILNMGSDNVMPAGELENMIDVLIKGEYQGVSAQTKVEGQDYPSQGLNAWRLGRFRPGPVAVIGTPTLFLGELLREHPYDPERRFSDDSELCERWTSEFGARFAISDAYVLEIGKTSWAEVAVRCRMYGVSDEEVFTHGVQQGWSTSRRLKSIAHPAKVDLIEPLIALDLKDAVKVAPFLAAFTTMRYVAWGSTVVKKKLGRYGN